MNRGPGASPVITIACSVCGARPDERCASYRYPGGRPRTFASEFNPDRAAAAVGAR